MDNRRGDKRAPIRDGKLKIKQEKLSPDRPQRARRSSSGSSRSSASPPPRRRDHSSPVRERDRSPERRDGVLDRHGDRPAGDWRSRSPHHRADNRIKREKEEHNERGNEIDERHAKREEQRHHRRDRERGQERHRDGSRGRDGHLYQQQQAERDQQNERRRENRHRQEENEALAFGDGETVEEAPAAEKEKPSFELSGALVEDTNTYKGVVIKYNEPPEARIPKRRWRLYPFKNDEPLPVMYIHRQSAYLLGRQRRIADIPIDHPSCSKQHAVFQYRLVEFTRADGTTGRRVKPYIIDLGSGNGTYLNNQRIEPQRYYELKEKDVLKFGFSSREYVLLHEFSDTTEVDAKKEEDEEDEEDEGLDE